MAITLTSPGAPAHVCPAASPRIKPGDDLVRVRQQARAAAAGRGLSLVDQTKLVTTASKSPQHLIHGGGTARIDVVTSATGRRGVRIKLADTGPGTGDTELALSDGWSSGNRLGLSGSLRLVDEFELASAPRGLALTSRSPNGHAERIADAGRPSHRAESS